MTPAPETDVTAVARRSLQRFGIISAVWIIVMLAILILAASTGYDILDDRAILIKNEQERLFTQARVIENNLARQVESVTDVLRSVTKDSVTEGMNRRLSELSVAIPGVRTLLILDKEGVAVASNRESLLRQDFSTRDYYLIPRKQMDFDSLYVSPPFKTVLNNFVINLSIIIPGKDGGFKGIAGASLDPDYFNVTLNSVLYANDMWSSITHGDGLLFMMVPQKQGTPGMNLAVPGSFFTLHSKSGKSENAFIGRSYLTGGRRIVAMRTFNPPQLNLSKPLVIAVSRDMAAVLVDWRRDSLIKGFSAVLLSGFLVVGTFFILRHQRNLDLQAQQLYEEQVLARYEARRSLEWQKTYDAVNDSICLLDATSRIVQCNNATFHIFETSEQELVGRYCWDIFAEPAMPHADYPSVKAMEIKTRVSGEVCIHDKFFEVTVDPIFTDDKDLSGFVHVMRDISIRKRQHIELERLLSILEASINELYVFETDTWRFSYVNSSALKNLGYRLDELKTMTPLDIKPDLTRDIFENLISPLLLHEQSIVNFETIHRRADGTVYPVEVFLQLVEARSSSSSSSHFLAVIQDISKRKVAERELRRSVERLELMQEVNQYHATNVQDLLDFALEKVIALTESRIGYIYHYYEDEQKFVLNTWSKGVMPACSVNEPQSVYQLEKTGIWGEVIRQRQPILVNDFAAPDPLKKGYPEGHVHLSRFLSVPVFFNDRIVAVVGVANKTLPYDQVDILQLTLMMEGVWKIGERLILEEQISRAGHEWQHTFDSISDSIALIDAEQRIKRCNQATCHVLGLPFDDIINQPCWKLFHGTDAPIPDCPMTKSVLSGHSETSTIRRGGQWLEVTVDPIRNSTGALTDAVHIVRDVTGRKLLEETLYKSLALLDLTARQAHMGGWEINLADNELTWTDEIYRIYEVEPGFKPTVQNTIAFYAPESLPIITAAVKRTMNNCEPFDLELCLITAKNNRRIVQARGQTLLHDGSPVKVVGTFRDITEQRELETEQKLAAESIREMQSQLMQQDKLATIGQLAAGVAHEINNPMGFVSSNMATLGKYIDKYNRYIELLENELRTLASGRLTEQAVSVRQSLKLDYVMRDISVLIEESNDGIERVKRIVKDLRTFSRSDDSTTGSADLNACMESTINIVINEIKYVAELQREYGDLPKIQCNAQQINQVFMNLLINAAHAIQAKGDEVGEIVIRSWFDQANVFVSVSDNGCGITQENCNKIFDAFFTTKEVGKGTGLGLSISAGIIRKHAGEITVTSEVDKGSTFTVRLPVNQTEPSEAAHADNINRVPSG